MNVQRPPRTRSAQQTTSRGVSDAIGFTLMFSIIIIGAGLISLSGGSQIASLSEAEEVRSAERGMEVTAATLEPMAAHNDEQRSFSVAFSNSNVWMNETTLNVTSESDTVDNQSLELNSLQQRFDRSGEDVTVRYEGGGVFRSNGVPAYDPVLRCQEGAQTTAIITVVSLTLDERAGISITSGYDPDLRFNDFAASENTPITSTDEVLNFRAYLDGTERYLTEGEEIYVNTSQTAGPEQWDQYFDDREGWEQPNEDKPEYTCDADRALVRFVTLELDVIDPRFSN